MAYIGSGLTRFNTADDLTVTDDAEIGGDLTVTGSADINGGTIDGVTIGGASAGAGTFTELTVDGIVQGKFDAQSNGGDTSHGLVLRQSTTDTKALIAGYSTSGTLVGGAYIQAVNFGTAYEDLFIQPQGGNVGIGQTTNLAKFTVNGGTANIVSAFRSTDAGAYIGFADNTTTLDASIYPYVFAGASGNDFLFGTNNTERMRIDSSGRVTKPYQPYFEARRNGNLSGFNTGDFATSVQFNLTDTNLGNHYSTTTGLFTAPVTGVYAFDAWVYSDTNIKQAWLTINGGRGGKTDVVQTTAGAFMGGSWTIKLTANDTVGFHPYANNASITIIANGNHTYFRGCLIG